MGRGPAVVVVESGGSPFTQVDDGVSAPPFTAVEERGTPITLVDTGGFPANLFNPDGTVYGGDIPFEADFARNRYRWNGVLYFDEATFLAAVGGVAVGNVITVGPYIAPDAPQLITNGQFTTDLTGWTSVLNGISTVAVVTSRAQMVSDGTTGTGGGGAGLTQTITTVDGQAYYLTYTNGTASSANRVGTTLYGSDLGGGGTQSAGARSSIFSSNGVAAFIYFFRQGAGTATVDDVSAKVALPFLNYTPASITIKIEGKTPSTASGTKDAFELSGSPNTNVRIGYNSSGHMTVSVLRYNSPVASLDLGAVAGATDFSIIASLTTNGFFAQLNGGLIVSDTAGILPGLGLMTIGSDVAGNTWGNGEIYRIAIGGAGLTEGYRTEGDSFMGGAVGVSLPTTMQTLMAKAVVNTGVGGSSMAGIRDRMLLASNAGLLGLTTIIWDGSANAFVSVDAYCDELAAGLAALSHSRFVLIPECNPSGSSGATQARTLSILNAFETRWPGHVLDWRNVLVMNGADPAAAMFADLPGDTVHLSQAAMDLMAAAIDTFVTTRDW